MRGGSYDENMIYVNGMEIARPLLVRSAQQEGLSFVNPRMTERVDFSAGGFTAEYGDKMSSVLDIRYKKPAQFEAAVDLGLQGDNLYIGSNKGGFSQITGVRFKDGRNMLSSLETKGEYRPLYLDAQTYMVQRLSSKWQLSLLAQRGKRAPSAYVAPNRDCKAFRGDPRNAADCIRRNREGSIRIYRLLPVLCAHQHRFGAY